MEPNLHPTANPQVVELVEALETTVQAFGIVVRSGENASEFWMLGTVGDSLCVARVRVDDRRALVVMPNRVGELRAGVASVSQDVLGKETTVGLACARQQGRRFANVVYVARRHVNYSGSS